MKKFNLLLLFLMMSVTSNSQVYSSIQYLDKFNDIVKSENIKTLITKTDSTFVVEEKGRQPVQYYILNYADYASQGSKDNLVDLTGTNVYGFQDTWCVIKLSDVDEYFAQYGKVATGELTPKDLQKYWLFFVHRTISKYSFEFQYDSDYIWIQNEMNDDRLGKNVARVIYVK